MAASATQLKSSQIGLTELLARQVVNSAASDFSEELFEHATLAFMDWLSVAVVAREAPVSTILLEEALEEGGHPQASIIAHPHKVSAPQAARVNGTMSHAFDYDDTLLDFMGHPTASIMPALAALSEARRLSGKQMLSAYLVGLQAGVDIAQSTGPEHYQKGFHGTATIGRLAATAACAHLLGLSVAQTINALGIAGTECGGLRRSFGTMAKPYHAGMAAEGGVKAALFAERGFSAGQEILEGQFGFFDAMHGQDNTVVTQREEAVHPVELLSPKIHAACHCTHAPIEIMQSIADNLNLDADDIESVLVNCSQVSFDNANVTNPKSGLEGKFSINYSMANALIRNDTGLKGYTDDMVSAPEVRALMKRIKVEVDDAHRDADLTTTCHFKLRSGETISRTLNPVEQAPSLSSKREQILRKFDSLCSMVYDKTHVEALRNIIERLRETQDAAEAIRETQSAFKTV